MKKLLHVAKWYWGYILQTPSFLNARVTSPDIHNYNKMKLSLKCIEGTIDLLLTISIESMNVTKWHVDSLHAICNDMRGQIGAYITIGKGITCILSTK